MSRVIVATVNILALQENELYIYYIMFWCACACTHTNKNTHTHTHTHTHIYTHIYIYIYIYIYISSLSSCHIRSIVSSDFLSHHPSLAFITLTRSSRLHPIFRTELMYVLVGRPIMVRRCVGLHKRISLMSSFLLLQQYPACFNYLTCIICEIGGKSPHNSCFIESHFQDLLQLARSILVRFSSSLFSIYHILELTEPQLRRIPVLSYQRD